jgi:phospholipid/cholesterol/gamma-HCH transport system substrate-binding protein
MSIMNKKDPRFAGIEKKIGFFVITAVICIIGSIIFIGLQRGIFTAKEEIKFLADSGTDLNAGYPVKFKGFNIGKITDVSLNEDGHVLVTMTILNDYMRFVRKDSIASFIQGGVIGESMIEIVGGSADQPQAQDGDSLKFERGFSLNTVAKEMQAKVEEALDEVMKITRYVNDPEGDVKVMLGNIRQLSEDLHHTRQSVDNLVLELGGDVSHTLKKTSGVLSKVDKTTLPEVTNTLHAVQNAIGTAQETVKDVRLDLQEITDKLSLAMDDVLQITNDIKLSTPRIPFLIEEGQGLMQEGSEIMDGIKRTWPLSLKFEHKEQKPLRTDSYE